MKKASFLTRLRFSYTVALLEILFAALHGRTHSHRGARLAKLT